MSIILSKKNFPTILFSSSGNQNQCCTISVTGTSIGKQIHLNDLMKSDVLKLCWALWSGGEDKCNINNTAATPTTKLNFWFQNVQIQQK